jgi:asparagine synthase (glutamine-hydrolysing)
VVLSGDGGDEAFGGYPRYAGDLREHRIRQLMPAGIRSGLVAPIAARWPEMQWLPRPFRAKTLLTNVALPAARGYANTLAVCRVARRRRLLAPDVRRSLNGYEAESVVAAAYDSAAARDPVAAMIAADISIRLPDDYLVKVDRASMAHGLEVRPPFLDHELLELTATMPSRFKVRRGETKRLLKNAFRPMLPASVLDRPKHGFAVPLDAWFRGPLRAVLQEEAFDRSGAFGDLVAVDYAKRLLREHVGGAANHGSTLWALLVFAKWADRYLRPHPIVSPHDARAISALSV